MNGCKSLLFIALLCLQITACRAKNQNLSLPSQAPTLATEDIVGIWIHEKQSDDGYYEFHADGTYLVVSISGVHTTGSWNHAENGKIILTYEQGDVRVSNWGKREGHRLLMWYGDYGDTFVKKE